MLGNWNVPTLVLLNSHNILIVHDNSFWVLCMIHMCKSLERYLWSLWKDYERYGTYNSITCMQTFLLPTVSPTLSSHIVLPAPDKYDHEAWILHLVLQRSFLL